MARRPHQRTLDRTIAWTLSLGAHLVLLLAILMARVPEKPPEPEAIQVSLFEGPPLADPAPPKPPGPPDEAPPKAAPTPPKPVPPKPPPPIKLAARPVKAPPTVRPIPVKDEAEAADPAPAPPAQPSDAQMAGALVAGSGAGGGSGGGGGGGGGTRCDMVRRLQLKLREDAMVQAAFAAAHRRFAMGSKVIWLWNGDWVRSPGEDGKGLSVVRQAVIWEVGFAPEACRREPVHGLVLISLNDQPGAPRLAIGQGSWRWPDLLFPSRTASN